MSSLDKSKSSSTIGLSSVIAGTILSSISIARPLECCACSSGWSFPNVSGMTFVQLNVDNLFGRFVVVEQKPGNICPITILKSVSTDLGKFLSARCARSLVGHMNGENAIRAYLSACSIMFMSFCGNRWTMNDRSVVVVDDALPMFWCIGNDDDDNDDVPFPAPLVMAAAELPSGIRYIRNRLFGRSTGSRISPAVPFPAPTLLLVTCTTSSYGN
ncbi:hypothetical protein AGLY_007110 [Aphis glycines]|uniref:Uncharacterized protein n=1 Tax=Aphis glycines TaxID=307491 RepID=A0A6G0TP75_APHGL|nr:hypothetical protein AGLY_007110 [Aphis glycines]